MDHPGVSKPICTALPIFSPGVSGVLARELDVEGLPLAAGPQVVLLRRMLNSGTLRADANVVGTALPAGTWFEPVTVMVEKVAESAACGAFCSNPAAFARKVESGCK